MTSVLVGTSIPGLDLVPATLRLAGAEVELVSVLARERRLAKALSPLLESYDFILIDCPPSLGLLTMNALAAAQGVLVPIQCEFYALEGLGQLMQVVDMIREHLNPELAVQGVLLTLHDSRLNLSEQVSEEVRRHFGPLVYHTVIPRNVKLAEAPSFGKPVIEYDLGSRGAQAYLELAREVMRMKKRAFRTRSVPPCQIVLRPWQSSENRDSDLIGRCARESAAARRFSQAPGELAESVRSRGGQPGG